MTGAKLLFLQNHCGIRVDLGGGGTHQICLMTCHDNRAIRVKRTPCAHGMFQHRSLCNRVQDFWQIGIHPGAFACGEDDEGSAHGVFSL